MREPAPPRAVIAAHPGRVPPPRIERVPLPIQHRVDRTLRQHLVTETRHIVKQITLTIRQSQRHTPLPDRELQQCNSRPPCPRPPGPGPHERHQPPRRVGDAAGPAVLVRDRVQRAVHARRPRYVRVDGGRYQDFQHWCGVLGTARGPCPVVAARAIRLYARRGVSGQFPVSSSAPGSGAIPSAALRALMACVTAAPTHSPPEISRIRCWIACRSDLGKRCCSRPMASASDTTAAVSRDAGRPRTTTSFRRRTSSCSIRSSTWWVWCTATTPSTL